MSRQALSPPPVFSDAGAQDNAVIVREAQEWIEEVTGKSFGDSFKDSLKDGVLLCELMKKINPGSISKINKLKSPIAHLDNIQQFLNACQELGMKESQLFDVMDLQSSQNTPRKIGVKRDDADRKIRSVCMTLYWLGRTVEEMEEYRGPQLDRSAFSAIMQVGQYSDDEESNESPIPESHDHYQIELDNHISSPELPSTGPIENGMGLTFEQEQTADQLLADIQSAVDEMLHDFQSGYIPEEIPEQTMKESGNRVGISVHMISRNGGFGFQVIGGADANYHPEVELILPGSAAGDAGIKAGDKIVSVNKEDMTRLTHSELVSVIKKAGSEGSMLIGLVREGRQTMTEHQKNPPADTVPDIDDQQLVNEDPPDDNYSDSYPLDIDRKETSPLRPPPTTSYGSQPLSTLVEYQEETLLEQITDMLEKSPPPPDSPPTPTHSSPVPITPPPPAPVSDDRESIERDLQEIVLMEMAATTEQQRNLKDEEDTSDKELDENDQQYLNIDDEIEELLSFGRDSKSPANDFELDFDLPPPLSVSPPPLSVSPPPLSVSPPPPKPTTEAPKRRVKKGTPPPTKAKPKRPASFIQATVLPPRDPEPERARSSTPRITSPPPLISPPPHSPPPVISYEPIVKVNVAKREVPEPTTVASPRAETSPITADTPSPHVQPSHVDEQPTQSPPVTMNSPFPQLPEVNTQPRQPTPVLTPSPQLTEVNAQPRQPTPVFTVTTPSPQLSPLPVESFSPQPSQAIPVIIDTAPLQTNPIIVNMPSIQLSEVDAPSTHPPEANEPNTTTIQAMPTTPISQPLQVKELGPVTPDDVEIVGNIKIHCVQRTRWTPKGSSTEVANTPEDQNKQRYQQHFTQMWAQPASKQTFPSKQTITPTSTRQNGYPEPNRGKATTPNSGAHAHLRTSPRTAHDMNKRYTQPVSMAGWQHPIGRDKSLSKSNRNVSPQQQQMPIKKPNWKSQEELRIHRNVPPPNGSTEQQWTRTTPVRQQSMPTQQQLKTQSLPRGNNDWRVNRSSTWSRGGGSRSIDGQQSAVAIKAKSPYDLCSRCHKQLGTETIMSIPNLKAHYHASCFVCRMCRAPLVRSPHNTVVLIKGMHPHCKYCVLSDQGVLTTEC